MLSKNHMTMKLNKWRSEYSQRTILIVSRCKEYNSELIVNIAKTQTTQKMAQDYADTIAIMKNVIADWNGIISKEITDSVKKIEKSREAKLHLEQRLAEAKEAIDEVCIERPSIIFRWTNKWKRQLVTFN